MNYGRRKEDKNFEVKPVTKYVRPGPFQRFFLDLWTLAQTATIFFLSGAAAITVVYYLIKYVSWLMS